MRFRWLVAAVAATVLAGCGEKDAEGGGEAAGAKDDGVLTFSVLATENSRTQASDWAPLFADMEKQTGLKVKPFFQSNYTGLIEGMRFKQIDAGWFSNQSGLEAVRRADGEVFVRSSDPSGVDGYNSILITNVAKPITLDDVLKCDKTLSFGIGDAKSTSGTLAPMTYLFAPRGIDPRTCFRTVRAANHESNMLSVANGVLDVATNNSTAYGILQGRKPDVMKKVKIIWTSPRIPEDPLVWRKDLDPATKEKVRQFFLTYGAGEGPEAERQRAILERLSFGVFQPADDSHLLPVREMEATEALLAARGAKDQAKIAEAERDLQTIRNERAAAEARAGVKPAA
jgi:phosphonate transport system substrate-binding protein